jgi:hypothetical protein
MSDDKSLDMPGVYALFDINRYKFLSQFYVKFINKNKKSSFKDIIKNGGY